MAQQFLTLDEVYAELFREYDLGDSDEQSACSSWNEEDEDVLQNRVDVLLDLPDAESPCPQSAPSLPQSTSPPPAKNRKTRGRASDKKRGTADQPGRWHSPTEEDLQPPSFLFRPRRAPGVQLDMQRDYSPSEIFQLFFSKEVLLTLCRHTNAYAAHKKAAGMKRQWKDIDADEMLRFFSIIVYAGMVKTPELQDLWRKDKLHSMPFPASVMSGVRFMTILANLHMSDPAADKENDRLRGQPGHDRLFRLKPLMDQILTACKSYYHPHQNLAVDERMVASKAKHGLKQYMKAKPTKWGFKFFVLADSSNGYTFNYSLYQGKGAKPSGNGLSYDTVVNLLHVPTLGTGYTVYVDNFYTSSHLFRYLHSISFGACGTIHETRIGFPKTQANALPKKTNRGDMRWIRDGPLLFVKWRDTRDVTMCSTVHKAYSGQAVPRRVKDNGHWSAQQIDIPEPVRDYNKFMGGVDLSDALIKYYSVAKKSRRWYMKLFMHFIDIAAVNSFIIYKDLALARKRKPITQKRFREELCLQLAAFGQPQAPTGVKAATETPPPTPEVPKRKLLNCLPVPCCELSTDPFLKATKGRRTCVYCKMKTIYMCKSCKVPLCLVVDRLCFTAWHEKEN